MGCRFRGKLYGDGEVESDLYQTRLDGCCQNLQRTAGYKGKAQQYLCLSSMCACLRMPRVAYGPSCTASTCTSSDVSMLSAFGLQH